MEKHRPHNFKQLTVWQKSVDLAVDCYGITKDFPREEQFGLTSQINRAAVSIPANIAEGAGRRTDKDFGRFLDIARGSTNELETLLIIAERVELLENKDYQNLEGKMDEIQKMLFSFQRSLNS